MRVLICPDKFRGTVDAAGAAEAMAAAVRAAGHRAITIPMADGGEGTLDVLGGANRTTTVSGPLGDQVEAGWRFTGRAAVIEMARASGLALVGGVEDNDAVSASTFGTGELILAATEAGATRIVVGVGGSASTDGGLGALRALYPAARLRGVDLVVACDVQTRFTDAAEVFGPQKGASPAQVELLRRRLERLVEVYLHDYGVDVSELDGAGAAGGLAGGLACIGARLVPGFDLVAEEVGLEDRMEEADLVITGEGFVDEASFDGKVVGGVAELAESFGVPLLVVAGECFDGVEKRLDIVTLVERFGRERALGDTAACLTEAVAAHLASSAG